MIGPAISDILPLAFVVMLSPIPIVAIILMLFTPRARTTGPAFVLGWVVGLALVSAVVYLIADTLDVASDSGASDSASTVKMVLGVVLVLLGVRRWRSRPGPGETEPTPKWMQALDEIGAGRAVGLGLLLSAVNPKNLLLTVAAAVSVAQAGLSAGDAALVLAVFVIVGSLAVAAAVVTYLVAGDRAEGVLTTWKVWLEHNNAAVMAVLFVVIGVVVFSKGLGPITA